MADKLATYHAKRNFTRTPEPRGAVAATGSQLRFVVQKHHARRLHYDFRLELDGTLKSWAVPKGPSLDPAEKRLAVHVEDHPLDYIDFEGDIPERQYGAGHVEVWDTGTWEPQDDPLAAYRAGKIKFRLDGEKLRGGWTLVRTRLQASSDKEQWLLIKEKDDAARASDEIDITEAMPDSVLNKKTHGAKAMRKSENKVSASAVLATPAAAPGKAKNTAKNSAKNSATNEAPRKTKSKAENRAVKAPLPERLSPQLATLVDAVPTSGDWLYEIKFDGYRVLARVEHGKARLFTRDGKDWTARLPKQVAAIEALGLDSAWLDGEMVVLDEQGVPSFQKLQNAFDQNSTARIIIFLFDLPYLNGIDLRQTPLNQRRQLLEQLLAHANDDLLRYSYSLEQAPQKLLDSACALALEGLIGKQVDSPYTSARSKSWIKLKCRRRQEMVIAGYTEPQGSRQFFGALLLGVYGDDGALHYAGRVGTGFDGKLLASLSKRMKALEQDACPFRERPSGVRNHVHWIRPELVAEISFAEWTSDGSLRQAVFHGLRNDKPAHQVRRENAASMAVLGNAAAKDAASETTGSQHEQSSKRSALKRQAKSDLSLEGVKITHGDRIIDGASGLTKFALARYYQQIAPLILPFLKNRPVYLLRAPEGTAGEQFFQKHNTRMTIPGMRTLDPALDPGHAPLMVIDSASALVGAAQMGTIELHVPNVTAERFDRPDCMVFDLDPDPELPWQAVVEAAELTRVVLDELGLRSFLKTSGGKGLHLVVPLARRHDWDMVASFSQAVAHHLARTLPKLFSARMGAKNRIGKVFIDYLRNKRSASTVAPYAARARAGLPVAVPLAWDELKELSSSAQWSIAALPELLDRAKDDPWADYFRTRQMLTAAMKKKLGLAD